MNLNAQLDTAVENYLGLKEEATELALELDHQYLTTGEFDAELAQDLDNIHETIVDAERSVEIIIAVQGAKDD